jgi:exodeoxyribonuclease VII large subunit
MVETRESGANTTTDHPQDILSVGQLNERIDESIQSTEGLHSVRCVGEVTDLSAGNSARYFTLTDGDCELRCVLWESRYQNMDIDLENGMEVILEGNVDFWREGGEISLKPWEVTSVGEGEQAAAINRLERELEQRGWFDDDHKQYPPRFPERVGVVTSLQGDARYDIQNAIHEEDPTVDILIKDTTVQGSRAPRSIANGIHHFDRHEDVDVIIAGRGGGSDTDLMAFNSEEIAEAIFTASTPVITAVGHTDDRVIADKVADMAAITPTRAGEYVAGSREEYIEGTIQPLERELEDAYDALEQEHEYEQELIEGERRLTYYRVAVVVLVLLLLIVLALWQVV